MWKEFRDLAFKECVVDLAIGVIIGGAFGKDRHRPARQPQPPRLPREGRLPRLAL